ncbi:MAG: hypothetical protein GW839_14620 [Flavobacteriales bacterium]|nr:hypothetical protein [Flavobacteriales bacterium]NCQ13220.1 hypothetical protein [Flavobacteriales bacterium]
MRLVFRIILFILLIHNSAYSQSEEKRFLGGWFFACDICEFNDLIILRSDHHYFIYNPNSADISSFELTGELKSNDIKIDGAYTAMNEKGTWEYNSSTKQLVLKERNILEEWTDFSEAYGREKELAFSLKQLSENEIELCFDKKGKQVCEKYERNNKYREINEDHTGTGNQLKEILLSGYETVLKLSYEFYKEPDQLILEDKSGKVLFNTDRIATSKRKTIEIPLKGVTKLVFKISNEQNNSKWKINVEIK